MIFENFVITFFALRELHSYFSGAEYWVDLSFKVCLSVSLSVRDPWHLGISPQNEIQNEIRNKIQNEIQNAIWNEIQNEIREYIV